MVYGFVFQMSSICFSSFIVFLLPWLSSVAAYVLHDVHLEALEGMLSCVQRYINHCSVVSVLCRPCCWANRLYSADIHDKQSDSLRANTRDTEEEFDFLAIFLMPRQPPVQPVRSKTYLWPMERFQSVVEVTSDCDGNDVPSADNTGDIPLSCLQGLGTVSVAKPKYASIRILVEVWCHETLQAYF